MRRSHPLTMLLYLLAGFARPLVAQVDQQRAQEFFKEAQALCERDGGRLWGVSVCGPMVIADRRTQTLATSRPAPEGARPQLLGIVNAPVEWGGTTWAAYVWDDVVNRTARERNELLLHELFHGVQKQLGLMAPAHATEHLDAADGRYWLRLEWRALARALGESGDERNLAVRDALAFRQARRVLYPASVEDEHGQEITEGLAAYTGTVLAAPSAADAIAGAVDLLANAEADESFVRTFAYKNGPAYGVLLDASSPGWTRRVRGTDDLATLLMGALALEPATDAAASAARYGGAEIRAAELKREQERQERLADSRRRFVDGPVLRIPGGGSGMSDSRGAVVIPGVGTVYFGPFRASGAWGTLEAEKGVLVASDGSFRRVPAPAQREDGTFAGDGWTFKVATGWVVREGARQGDYEAVRQQGQSPSPGTAPFDLILRGGSVLDGTGRPAYRGDVAVLGSRIAKIGDLSRDSGTTVIDVSGLVVAPGFINIHSHASPGALPSAANMLRQGVTTEILNPDGSGALDIAAQLAAAESASPAVNIGAYAPFNSAWASVVGNTDRRPTPEQIAQITALLERGLEAGAWGVSAGLDYKPAYYAKTDEVIGVLSPLRGWRTNFPNHDRLTPEAGFSSLAAMQETIEIGERAALVPVITHMKVQGHNQGRADEALAAMRAATARGVYTAADVYPYLAGQTALAALFIPGWAQEGGREALVQRLRDPPTRARIVRETEEGLVARVGGPENVYVIGRNKTVAQLMAELGGVSPGEAIARILEVESPGMIATFGAEPDLVKILQYPDAAIACDCGAARTASHPRFFGTFPRVLGHYVRESRALRLADAVRKMTALPATIIGIVDRGFLAPGMAADITVFDAATVIDHATYERPTAWSDGIRVVVVNGRVVLRDGEPTGTAAGRTLRRTRLMPSRPMNVASSLSLRAEAAESGRRISVDLARRKLRVDGAGGALDGIEFGLLQTAPQWASVTGLVRDSATGQVLGFVLIVDEAAGALTLLIDGRPTMAATIVR